MFTPPTYLPSELSPRFRQGKELPPRPMTCGITCLLPYLARLEGTTWYTRLNQSRSNSSHRDSNSLPHPLATRIPNSTLNHPRLPHIVASAKTGTANTSLSH